MLEYFLLAQTELAPKFQPGPARVPEQTPILRPKELYSEEPVLDQEDKTKPDKDTNKTRQRHKQIRDQLKTIKNISTANHNNQQLLGL